MFDKHLYNTGIFGVDQTYLKDIIKPFKFIHVTLLASYCVNTVDNDQCQGDRNYSAHSYLSRT